MSTLPSLPSQTGAPARNANGMPIEPFLGYARNFLGSGYNCPRLRLFGYATERALNAAIRKADNALRQTARNAGRIA